MAKLKDTPKTEEVAQEVVNTPAAPVEEAPEEAPAQVENQEKAEVPSNVDKILRMYPNYAKLFIDQQGGVYTEDSKHLTKAGAILYQNPYFKQ
ncbi:MAG: hypothetical protein ACI4T5_05390 [Prevotella sp.]